MIKMLLTLFLSSFILSCGQNSASKEILFVCKHGAARSPIAAAYFNKIAAEQNLNYHAIFRGTEPDKDLSSGTAKGLNEDNFDIKNWKPERVSENEINNAFKVITFDCELPINLNPAKTDQWNGTPPISESYEKARDIIKEKVERLVERLPKN